MTVLHQYDYIFAITTCFAFLDAWNIGKSSFLHALDAFELSELGTDSS